MLPELYFSYIREMVPDESRANSISKCRIVTTRFQISSRRSTA